MRKRIAGIAALAGERAFAGALLLIVGPAPASAQEGGGEAERRAARIARYQSAGAVRRIRTACESGEPDCSPHPFDIMAIYALYQTVDR